MTVAELIEELSKYPPEERIAYIYVTYKPKKKETK